LSKRARKLGSDGGKSITFLCCVATIRTEPRDLPKLALRLLLRSEIDDEHIFDDRLRDPDKRLVRRVLEVNVAILRALEADDPAVFESLVQPLGTVVRTSFKVLDLLDLRGQGRELLAQVGNLLALASDLNLKWTT
jgi:hypothetical protein